jgi:5-methylcytosine-specific restriction enzyme subunit McrC
LAKLIILKYSPDLQGGGENVLAIMFDMNLLYENYIYRKLLQLRKDDTISINSIKEQNRQPFWETKGIKADIIIEGHEKTIVIDTKWKVLNELTPSDADLKQMFVYNLHYQSELSILLYPQTLHLTQEKRAFRHASFNDKYCQLAFINLFDESGRLDRKLGYRIYHDLLKTNL